MTRPNRCGMAALCCALSAAPALAGEPIAFTNPDGLNTTAVSAQNPLPVACATCAGGGGGASGAQANATAPAAAEGATVPLSLDLNRQLRVAAAGYTLIPSAAFVTPAGTTAYAAGQLVADQAAAVSVTPLAFAACRVAGGTGMIRRARVVTTDTGFANGTVRLHLYRVAPTVSNGDHGAYLSTESGSLGDLDVTLDHAYSDPAQKGWGAPNTGSDISFDCGPGSTSIYGLLEVRGAVTPTGGATWTVQLEDLAN